MRHVLTLKKILKPFLFVIVFSNGVGAFSQQKISTQSKLVDSMEQWIITHPKVDSQYIQTLHRISYRLSETNINKSFEYYLKASYLSDSINFISGKSLAQINLGLLLGTSANFEGSNNAYFKAIEYAEKSGYLRLKSVSLNNIGDNFFSLRDYAKCRQYTNDAIAINTQLKQWRGVAVNYELLSRCDFEEKKYDAALGKLKRGLPFGIQSADKYILSQLYNGFAKLKAVGGEPDSAKYFFEKGLHEAIEENDLRNVFNIYLDRAKYLTISNKQQKLNDLDSAMTIAKQTSFLEGQSKAAQALSNLYEAMGNKDSSLKYYHIFTDVGDSMFSERNTRNVVIKEVEWKMNRKDAENNNLKDLADVQKKELNFKNGLLLASLLVLLLGGTVAFLIYNNSKQKKKHELAEQKQKEAELANQLNEMEFKAFKAQLNPHFIFNYLNSISGYILQSQPEKASNMIIRFSKMLRNLLNSSEQNLVPLNDDMATIKQYVELMQEITTPHFNFEMNAPEPLCSKGLQVPPLFIQPYIENAILHGLRHKHEPDPFLKINYLWENNILKITILDNGMGFNPKDAIRKKLMQSQNGDIHLGMDLTEKRIKIFAENNGYLARINFTTPFPQNEEPGTEVNIEIIGIGK